MKDLKFFWEMKKILWLLSSNMSNQVMLVCILALHQRLLEKFLAALNYQFKVIIIIINLYFCVLNKKKIIIIIIAGVLNPLSREPEKPSFSEEIKSEIETEVGKSAKLEAKVLGFPRPDVKWYHEDTEIKPEGRYKFLYDDKETITLVIKNVNPKDGGFYKIVAKNELGEECTELSLIVKGWYLRLFST